MKKLFYIVLVVVVLVVVGKYFKDKQHQEPATESVTIVTEEINPNNGEYSAESNDEDVIVVDEATVYENGSDGMVTVDETVYTEDGNEVIEESEYVEEYVEENPDMTAQDDETLVAE